MGNRLQAAWDRTPLPLETIAGIAAAVLVQRPRPRRLPRWCRPTGWLALSSGLALVIAALREREGQPLEAPGTLVTHGLHGRSRNPMYLGFTLIQAGLSGVTRNAWMLASCLPSATLLHRSILREEQWLRERFADEYDAYVGRVPRYW